MSNRSILRDCARKYGRKALPALLSRWGREGGLRSAEVRRERREQAGYQYQPQVQRCRRGHELTDENTYWATRHNGPREGQRYRQCRACRRLREQVKAEGKPSSGYLGWKWR